MGASLKRYNAAIIVAVIVLVVSPFIWSSDSLMDNSILAAVFALLALSAGMSYGQAGIPSVATAAFAAIGAYCTAIVSIRFNVPSYVGLPLAVLVPGIVAYPVARAVSRLSPLPLSIATLVLSGVVEIAIREGGDFTGGYVGLSGIAPLLDFGGMGAIHLFAWFMVVVVLVFYANLMDSAFGRAVNTTRHDPMRAQADSVDTGCILSVFFSLSACVAGLGGWIYAHYISYLGPESLTTATSISVLLMAIIGGARTLLGPVVGAVLLTIITNLLPASETQGMVYGGALVIALCLAPRGIVGTIRLTRPGKAPATGLVSREGS